VEEGLGIGAPVCLYEDGARFSVSALTYVTDSVVHPSVVKVYNMNALEVKRFRHIIVEPKSYAKHFLGILEKAYRGVPSLHIGAGMMLNLVSLAGLRNEYVETSSKGQIRITYEPSSRGIAIKVNLESLMTEGLIALGIGNEQGGNRFTEYSDSLGERLEGGQIEPWRPVLAEWAILRSPESGVCFTLHRPDGWQIIRGREVVGDRISWSGLNLQHNGIPTSTLEYNVETNGDA
jgi:hypothetical protein